MRNQMQTEIKKEINIKNNLVYKSLSLCVRAFFFSAIIRLQNKIMAEKKKKKKKFLKLLHSQEKTDVSSQKF